MYLKSSGQSSRYRQIVKSQDLRSNSMAKSASMWGTGAAQAPLAMLGSGPVARMAMKPFSPIYQESNLMLPKDRKTMNAYNRHYYETDYWVGNVIDLHTYYPLGGFTLISKDKVVEQVMRQAADRVDLLNLVLGLGLEYWVYGEAVPFLEWNKNLKMWDRATLFNPDLVEVKRTIFMDTPLITLIPDAELKRIATSTHPADVILRDQIPSKVLEFVLRGENIPLNARNVSHIVRRSLPHDLRGTSIIQRVWKELMLRDAFREVLFVMAQNHITPLKIFRIGGKDEEYYPDQNELGMWQSIIEEAQNDPNFSIITHKAFDVEYKGATGQIVDITKYLEIIENNVLTGLFASKAMTSGDGPCVIAGTEVLTRGGWKVIDDCTTADEVASVNPNTGAIEYCFPKEKFAFDVTGPMYHFKSGMVDHCVTPNHRCWVKGPHKDEYGITLAENIGSGYKFKSVVGWNGVVSPTTTVPGYAGDTNKYLKFMGLYLSEGSLEYNGTTPASIRIAQTENHKFGVNPRYADVKSAVLNFALVAKEHQRTTYLTGNKGHFEVHNTDFAKHVLSDYSEGSANKRIPVWVKSLASEHLEHLLQGCFLGDGSNYGKGKSYEIYTVSRQLADDLQEVALKCGYATKILTKKRDAPRQLLYRVIVLVNNIKGVGREPEVRTGNIHTFDYTGKVFSFDLPINKIYVTRRNGLVTVTGNTYANSQVAYEILQKRYVFFRNIIEQWLTNKFFLPISIAHGFKKDDSYVVPQIKWQRMDFKRDADWVRLLQTLWEAEGDKKLVSDRTMATEAGFDFDEEQELLINEKAARIAMKEKAKPDKDADAQGGGLPGLGGGMPDLGGGMGGGDLPPLDGLGGGAAAPAPGGDLGGAGGAPPPTSFPTGGGAAI